MDKTQALFDYASSLTELKPSGGRMFGCCPLHQEKTPSFVVNGEKFNCYGCGVGGDVFDLWQAITGGTFIEAKKALGFWDHTRPAPIKKGPPPQKFDKVFNCSDKKAGWLESVRSLKAGYDQKILFCGHEYWNHEFIAECLRHQPEEEIENWLIKIVGWFKDDQPIRRELLINLINERLGRKKK